MPRRAERPGPALGVPRRRAVPVPHPRQVRWRGGLPAAFPLARTGGQRRGAYRKAAAIAARSRRSGLPPRAERSCGAPREARGGRGEAARRVAVTGSPRGRVLTLTPSRITSLCRSCAGRGQRCLRGGRWPCSGPGGAARR